MKNKNKFLSALGSTFAILIGIFAGVLLVNYLVTSIIGMVIILAICAISLFLVEYLL